MGFLAWILIRRHRLATVLLPVAIGVVAALAMALWINGDRSAGAYDRFVAAEQRPDVLAHVCPPEFVLGETPLHLCGYYPSGPMAELAAIRELPEVMGVGRTGWAQADVQDENDVRSDVPVAAILDGGYDTTWGVPMVVDGALPDPDDRTAVVASESLAEQRGWDVGDTIELIPITFGIDARAAAEEVTLAALIRSSDELVPHPDQAMGLSSLYVGPAWSAEHLDSIWASFAIDLAPGASIEELESSLRSTFPDRALVVEEASESAVESVIRDAARDERLALRALSLGIAIAGAFFAAQATIRQTRRELHDRSTLQALGVTPGQLVGLAVRRWAPSALLAAIVATAVSAALTALGPLGVGRRAPWTAQVTVSAPVVAVGSSAVVVLLLGAAIVAARPTRRAPTPTRTRTIPRLPVPLWATVGVVRPTLNRRSGSSLGAAIVGTAVAAAAFIAAAAVAGTLDTVIADPARTGADFDAVVSIMDEADAAATIDAVTANGGVERAAKMTGSTLSIDDHEVWVHAFTPIDGSQRITPVITSGREPVAAGEIALASLTMSDLGVDIGDTITVSPYVAGEDEWTAIVVGTALVNDLWEPTAGRGGIVSPATVDAHFPEEVPSIAVVFADDAAGAAARDEFAPRMLTAAAPRSVYHVARLDWVPYALAAIAGVMAGITFVHALYTTVRAQKADLATYRVLGLSRRPTVGIVLLESAGLALAAIVLALPIGLIVGRWGWELIADRLGLATTVQFPVRGIALAALTVAVVGVVVAGPIGRRATAGPIASSLRAE